MFATIVTTAEIIDWFIAVSFLWLPLVFAAYAIGRKRFGLRLLLIAMTIEAISLALGIHVFRERL